MNNIKILDCTLREGGYVNDWNFGKENILMIYNTLLQSTVDYIEYGYLKDDIVFDLNKTIFPDISKINLLQKTNLFLMINYGDVNIDNLNDKSLGLSVAFKKKNYIEALEFCNKLIKKDFRVFINPMSVNLYTSDELDYILQQVNKLHPFAFTLVDSFGSMKKEEVINLFEFFNGNLNPDIALSLHLHDGFGCAKSVVDEIAALEKVREIIIQTSINGVGRGVGNLKTEAFVEKLNISQISTFFKTKSDYELNIYRLASCKNIHPNYAKFLIENKISAINANKILSSISSDYCAVFNKDIIKSLI